MGQITVVSGPERRRRWTDEERISIVAEAFSPGMCVADVARRRDVSTSLIYTWRRQLRDARIVSAGVELSEPEFAEAMLIESDVATGVGERPAVIVDLPRVKRVSIFASASPMMVAAVLKALR